MYESEKFDTINGRRIGQGNLVSKMKQGDRRRYWGENGIVRVRERV